MSSSSVSAFREVIARSMRLPVAVAPMFLVSGPDLVLAACQSGVMGAFPTPNARSVEELDRWMTAISGGIGQPLASSSRQVIGPWAVNLITHSSNARLPADLELVARHKPPVVITALGGPKPAIDAVHGYGGIVVADVTSLRLARKAAAAGVDGLACVCTGAGGHTGDLSPFAFIAAVREFFDGIVIVGGGIGTGAGVAGAIAAGADLVYMGTSFIPAEESIALPGQKQMVVDCSVEDLMLSAAITGTPASWLRPSLALAGYDPDNLPPRPERNYDSNSAGPARWKDTWSAGQGLGSSRAIEPVAAIVDRLEREYHAALGRLSALSSSSGRTSP